MSTGGALPHQTDESAHAVKLESEQTTTSTKPYAPQADIRKFKWEPDGSFKRVPSVFRNFITKDGEFAAEKG